MQKKLRKYPADAWTTKGLELVILGRYQDALESYDKALSIDPNRASARIYRGLALSDLKRYQEALESSTKP